MKMARCAALLPEPVFRDEPAEPLDDELVGTPAGLGDTVGVEDEAVAGAEHQPSVGQGGLSNIPKAMPGPQASSTVPS